MNAIEIHGLEKHYAGFDLKLDLTLPQGCILGQAYDTGQGAASHSGSPLGAGEILPVVGQPHLHG